jgi:hypothetical protein
LNLAAAMVPGATSVLTPSALVFNSIALRALDLVACAAGLLAALAVERLPWAVLLAPMLTRLGARAAAGDQAAA